MPAVSIVIPAYNCAAFLPATLESVFVQTFTDWEAIVVDDGSTDNTPEVLAPYLHRITCIRQPNQGLPGARNTGIRAASGAFIALLDADDAWTPEKLARQMPRFADPGVGIVFSDFAVRYSDGRFQPSYLVNRPLAAEGFILDRYLQSRFLFPSTMILRRACFDQCGLFDPEMLACEDVELFARICLHWKVALINQPLMIRFEGVHNITANTQKMSRYTILAFHKILAREPRLPASTRAVLARELGRQYWWNGYAAFQQGDLRTARRSLTRAIAHDWHNLRPAAPLLAASLLPAPAIQWLRRTLRKQGAGSS